MKRFETRLPDGYAPVGEMDIGNKRTARILNAVGMALIVAVMVPSVLVIHPDWTAARWWHWVLLPVCFALYLVFHELLHGAAYALFVRGYRLTVGFSRNAVYCAVPQGYVYRAVSLIALLTPFTVFTLLFGAGMLWLPDAWLRTIAAILLSLHIGGCAGDLYDTALFLFRYRDPSTLTRDDGPRQIFYQKTED